MSFMVASNTFRKKKKKKREGKGVKEERDSSHSSESYQINKPLLSGIDKTWLGKTDVLFQ